MKVYQDKGQVHCATKENIAWEAKRIFSNDPLAATEWLDDLLTGYIMIEDKRGIKGKLLTRLSAPVYYVCAIIIIFVIFPINYIGTGRKEFKANSKIGMFF